MRNSQDIFTDARSIRNESLIHELRTDKEIETINNLAQRVSECSKKTDELAGEVKGVSDHIMRMSNIVTNQNLNNWL
jgi:hypothetical protein